MNLRPGCAMPNSVRSVMNGHCSKEPRATYQRLQEIVTIPEEDTMTPCVMKIGSDNDQSDYSREVM